MRVDEGFLGYSAARATTFSLGNTPVGVGKVVTSYRAPANSLTGYAQDFSRAAARGLNISPFGQDPVILVVKKNKTILTNLIGWLAGYAENDPDHPKRKLRLPDVPLLVIDDEADNASINTKPIPTDPMTGSPLDDYDVTAINGKIRQLLSLFSKTAYVGYTATPFANIFIHPEDRSTLGTVGRSPKEIEIPFGEGLFPTFLHHQSAHAVELRGAGVDLRPGARPRGGYRNGHRPAARHPRRDRTASRLLPRKHKSTFVPQGLPDTLKTAIRSFILACAARAHRGFAKSHNSMLVHVRGSSPSSARCNFL